jgi:hypothetical protein
MAQSKTMKPIANRRAVNLNLVTFLQLQPELIQGQFPSIRKARAGPFFTTQQLAPVPMVTLRLRLKTTRLATELDHVIDEPWRNSEMTRRRPMAMARIHKCDNAFT